MTGLDLDQAADTFAQSRDFTVGLEEEFALLHPDTLDLIPVYERLHDAAQVPGGLRAGL